MVLGDVRQPVVRARKGAIGGCGHASSVLVYLTSGEYKPTPRLDRVVPLGFVQCNCPGRGLDRPRRECAAGHGKGADGRELEGGEFKEDGCDLSVDLSHNPVFDIWPKPRLFDAPDLPPVRQRDAVCKGHDDKRPEAGVLGIIEAACYDPRHRNRRVLVEVLQNGDFALCMRAGPQKPEWQRHADDPSDAVVKEDTHAEVERAEEEFAGHAVLAIAVLGREGGEDLVRVELVV